MKKNLLWVALAAITMASCSSDEATIAELQSQEANAQGLMPINLSLSTTSATVAETRGTGTVGDTTGVAKANAFNFEDIYVLMMDVTNPTWAYTNCGGTLGEQFNNTFFCRPQLNGATGNYSLEYNGFTGDANGALKYYPMNGDSEFFGYYIDDAAASTTTNGNPAVTVGTNDITLPFIITGSQDIMAGKAIADSLGETISRFSNKTARLDITPSIQMKHMLTRFTFEVIAGDDGNNSLFIDTMAIKSFTNGTLTVAKKGAWDYDDLLVWDETVPQQYLYLDKLSATPATFTAGKPAVEPMDTIKIGAKGTSQRVGDALFVQPGKTQYQLYLRLKQWTQGATGVQEPCSDVYIPIKKSDASAFERGKSYHIKVTVYGMHEVMLEAELEEWKVGGDIEVDTDMSE